MNTNIKQMLCRNCFSIVNIHSLTEHCIQKQLCSLCLGNFRKEICPYCKEMRYELILISTVNELKHYLSPDNLLLDLIDKYTVYRYTESKKICKQCLYALCSNVNKQQVLLDHLGWKINMNNHPLQDEHLFGEKVQSQEHKCFDVNVTNSSHLKDSNHYERNKTHMNEDAKDNYNKHHSMIVTNSNGEELFQSVKECQTHSNKLNEGLMNNNNNENSMNMYNGTNNCKIDLF